MKTKIISPNAKCRVKGCQGYVPDCGWYPGMPQSRCTRCGMKLSCHSSYDKVPDFYEALYPESDWFYRIIERFKNNNNKKEKKQCRRNRRVVQE